MVLVMGLALAGCGRSRDASSSPPPVACDVVAERLRSCADEFWAAYAALPAVAAEASAARVELGRHVAEVRATVDAVGRERTCQRRVDAHAGEPGWARALAGCVATHGCPAFAACAAPLWGPATPPSSTPPR